jgi:hypothetical protein
VGWCVSLSAGIGVAGLDAVRRWPLSAAKLSFPLGVRGRESGGVAGTSPAELAMATTDRTMSFIAVSRDMVRTSISSSFVGGEGASWRQMLENSGSTPASPAGFGADGGFEGGSEGGSIFRMTGASTSRRGCTVLSGGVA